MQTRIRACNGRFSIIGPSHKGQSVWTSLAQQPMGFAVPKIRVLRMWRFVGLVSCARPQQWTRSIAGL